MRLALKFGIDNVVKLRCYTEPKPRNIGDTQTTKDKLRKYKKNTELTTQLMYLKRLDTVGGNELQVYCEQSHKLETIYRSGVLREIARLTDDWKGRGRGGAGTLVGCLPTTFDDVVAALDEYFICFQYSFGAAAAFSHVPMLYGIDVDRMFDICVQFSNSSFNL